MATTRSTPNRRHHAATNDTWTTLRERILKHRTGTPIDAPLASILASAWTGRGTLPPRLGLRSWTLRALIRRFFPGLSTVHLAANAHCPALSRLHQPGITAELADLETLLRSGSATRSPMAHALIRILAVGCLGFGHMWRDMGFASRAELRDILFFVSPRLARRNIHDMKWKKFLYRELCKSEVGYVCRSPSCNVCPDYVECFGPED